MKKVAECENCEWLGTVEETDGDFCPICGAEELLIDDLRFTFNRGDDEETLDLYD